MRINIKRKFGEGKFILDIKRRRMGEEQCFPPLAKDYFNHIFAIFTGKHAAWNNVVVGKAKVIAELKTAANQISQEGKGCQAGVTLEQ